LIGCLPILIVWVRDLDFMAISSLALDLLVRCLGVTGEEADESCSSDRRSDLCVP
jgi:hypothetical protein